MYEILFKRPGNIGSNATFRDKSEADAFFNLLKSAGYIVERLYA